MKKISMKQIENYISTEEKFIKLGNGKKSIQINIIEHVDVDNLHAVVESIANEIVEQEFAYTLFDILLPYHIMNLFTNIEIPMVKDDIPDYEACYKFCIKFDLINKLIDESSIIAEYISMIEKNILRVLEYKKALTSLIPYESLMDALNEFYRILDEIDKVVETQKNIDVESLISQINDISTQLSSLDESQIKNDI